MNQLILTSNDVGNGIGPAFASGAETHAKKTPLRGVDHAPQLLVVDDDPAMRKLLTMALKQDGYTIMAVESGDDALLNFATHLFDLVILDVNLPGMDGHAICTELRRHSHVPIVFVTAAARTDEMIYGLQVGADQYITKPFTVQELRARVQAVLTRTRRANQAKNAGPLRIGEIELNPENLEVLVRGKPTSLTPNEFRLLQYLMQRPDQLISKNEFQSAVWGYQASGDINFMRVTMRRLRMKIEADPSRPRYLKTIHGIGYQFCSQPPAPT